MFAEFKAAWRNSKDRLLFTRLQEVFQDRQLVDQLTNVSDYDNINPVTKELEGKQCLVVFLDKTPLLYVVPSFSLREKNYKLYYRVGHADIYTSTLLALDLNICAEQGAIVTLPEGMDLSGPQGVYYYISCNKRDIQNKKRILDFFLPLQREVSYKLNLVISRIMAEISNQQALSEEFNLPEGEYYDEQEED